MNGIQWTLTDTKGTRQSVLINRYPYFKSGLILKKTYELFRVGTNETVVSVERDSTVFIFIKFRYNARPDWLKQRALSEYRCTESRCHAISPFVKCLSEFSLGFFFTHTSEKPGKRKRALSFNGYRPSVRNSTNNTVIESEVSEEVSDENTEPSRKI